MESLLAALMIAVLVCAVIWIIVYLIETKLSPPAEIAWWVRVVAVVLTALVLLRAIWPHVP